MSDTVVQIYLLGLFGSGCGSVGHLLCVLLRLICLSATLLIGFFRLEVKRTETIWDYNTRSLSSALWQEGGEEAWGGFSQYRNAMYRKSHKFVVRPDFLLRIGKGDMLTVWCTASYYWHRPVLQNHLPLMYNLNIDGHTPPSAEAFSESTFLAYTSSL